MVGRRAKTQSMVLKDSDPRLVPFGFIVTGSQKRVPDIGKGVHRSQRVRDQSLDGGEKKNEECTEPNGTLGVDHCFNVKCHSYRYFNVGMIIIT